MAKMNRKQASLESSDKRARARETESVHVDAGLASVGVKCLSASFH